MESAGRPSYEELERLVAEQAAVIAGQAALIERQAALIEGLTARVAELERRLGTDSSTSSRPPSSDSPFTKAPGWNVTASVDTRSSCPIDRESKNGFDTPRIYRRV